MGQFKLPKTWRSTFFPVLGLLLGAYLSGCTQATADRAAGKKVILTTFTVLADMVQNVAGDKAIAESIPKPGSEIHSYEPTPSDLTKGQRASLILENGLNLERWAVRFYNSYPKVARVTLSDGIQPVDIAEDAYQGKPNPHAWMSPQNALVYVENIRKALVAIDPVNTDTYNANAANYSDQIRQALATIPADKRYLVSCEGAFSYLARDYGLQEVYLWAVNAERQATPKQIERVINTVKSQRIPAVFCESTVSNESQLQVAKETGAKFAGILYVDSLSPPNEPASTYLDLLKYNVNTLIKGLQEPPQ
jgi:manganese transport system substrate-binding protein